jgi:hypothetical protein
MFADIVDNIAMQIVVFIGHHLLGLHYHPWLFEVFRWLRLVVGLAFLVISFVALFVVAGWLMWLKERLDRYVSVKGRYVRLNMVAVRFDPDTSQVSPVRQDGRIVDSDRWYLLEGPCFLDFFGFQAANCGADAIQLWGIRKIWKGPLSRKWEPGPYEWTGKWVSIPTRGFEKPPLLLRRRLAHAIRGRHQTGKGPGQAPDRGDTAHLEGK